MIEQIARIGLGAAAARAGISARRAKEWRSRFKQRGEAGPHDRSSRPNNLPHATARGKRGRTVNLRRNYRLPHTEIARRAGVSAATAGRLRARISPSCPRWKTRHPSAVTRFGHPEAGALRPSPPPGDRRPQPAQPQARLSRLAWGDRRSLPRRL